MLLDLSAVLRDAVTVNSNVYLSPNFFIALFKLSIFKVLPFAIDVVLYCVCLNIVLLQIHVFSIRNKYSPVRNRRPPDFLLFQKNAYKDILNATPPPAY